VRCRHPGHGLRRRRDDRTRHRRPDPGGTAAEPRGATGRDRKVGSLHPTAVKVLTVLGFAVPVAHYQENAILTDEWADVDVVVQELTGIRKRSGVLPV
jgi:hypothetical protein